MLEQPPLSLYIHIPWCLRKCPYCDFNSHAATSELPEQEYVSALCKDLDADLGLLELADFSGFHSVFIGGGTPSLFSARAYEQLLDHIREKVGIERGAEITLEVNPGAAEAVKFRGYRKAGINRLSIGIQSFHADYLAKLGRIHSGREAEKAIELALAAGFDNFNLDLMHGLPGQSIEEGLEDLKKALSLGPTHLSWYQLTIEPNTEFYARPPPLPEDDLVAEMQDSGVELISEAGFRRYEVSAYSQPGYQSQHNLNYWLFGDYLGIGAGAHGKFSDPDTGLIKRTRKKRQPAHYLASELSRLAEVNPVLPEERTLEFLLNSLRLVEGFCVYDYEARTGVGFSHIAKQVESLCDRGLLTKKNDRVRTTARGFSMLNSLISEFIEQ
ncbi:MAG: YggW family oxidoreductase [Gammaproteobacteria bacterium]|nr:YggW family oxidoreductase [Gammaproteobacteria bacterium]